MNIATLAKMIGVSPDTLRRWTADYERFLTPTAHPGSGKTRVLSVHDMAVLNYVATARNTGMDRHTIVDRLREMQAGEWRSLPAVPPEWMAETETVPLDLAASRASEVAQLAVLQSELQHIRAALELAESKVKTLEDRLQGLEAEKGTLQIEKQALQLELATARGEAAALQARLDGYTMLLGQRPRNLVLIVLAALVLGAVLVAATFVLAVLIR